MNLPFVFGNLKSNYCKIVFLIASVISFYLVPKDIWVSQHVYIVVPYILIFSFTITCVVRTIKERIKNSLNVGSSAIGVVAGIIGMSAVQVCGLSTPLCGASIGAGILAIVFPNVASYTLNRYSLLIIVATMLIQLVSLYFMKCLKSAKPSALQINKEKLD